MMKTIPINKRSRYLPKYLRYKGNFFSDMARIFDFYSELFENYPIDSDIEKEDFESLLSDWVITGQDIRNATNQWKQKSHGKTK